MVSAKMAYLACVSVAISGINDNAQLSKAGGVAWLMAARASIGGSAIWRAAYERISMAAA